MFKALQPLLAERNIHIVLSNGADGKIVVYVEPAAKDDKESKAFTTPFTCCDTPEVLEASLPQVLEQWLQSRAAATTPLSQALAAAEAQMKAAAEEAKKKAQEKNKKPATATPAKTAATATPAKAIAAPTPSLLDDLDDEAGDEGNGATGMEGGTANQPQSASPAPAILPTASAEPVASTPPAVTVPEPAPQEKPAELAPAPTVVASNAETPELF